jgi:hypothetical protein
VGDDQSSRRIVAKLMQDGFAGEAAKDVALDTIGMAYRVISRSERFFITDRADLLFAVYSDVMTHTTQWLQRTGCPGD